MSKNRFQDTLGVRLNVDSLESRIVPSVTVRFDYSYDTSGLFQKPEFQAELNHAASLITSQLQDHLAPIIPSGGDTWQASFFSPGTNSNVTLPNLAIAADEIVVYIAAAPLGGGELGLTTTGGFSAAGSQSWLDTVKGRGQPGALAQNKTDFSTWGGMITFDSSVSWSVNQQTPRPKQYDLESVALHEMMHIFGFGLNEPAFLRNVQNGKHAGPNVVATMGAPVQLDAGADHWAQDTADHGKLSPLSPALPQGQHRGLTRLDLAALADSGWEVSGINAGQPAATVQTPVASVPTINPAPTLVYTAVPELVSEVATSSPNRTASTSAIISAATTQGIVSYDAAGRSYTRPLDVGVGESAPSVLTVDLNRDNIPDIVSGSGAGQSNWVKAIDGLTGATLATFQPFEESFTGGVNLSQGDLSGDGVPEIIVSPDDSGGPVVAIYDGAALAEGSVEQTQRFWGIEDVNFRGGARTSVGDLNNDHVPDLIVAAGLGGGPRISIYDGNTIPSAHVGKLISDFFAFESSLRNGANITVEDVNDDGFAEVIVGSGSGGAPRVIAYNGLDLMQHRQSFVWNFYAGDISSRAGVKVATTDIDNDSRPDLVTSIPGANGTVDVYNANSLVTGNPSPALILQPLGNGLSGIEIG